jgi:hypothetical protein
MTPAALAGPSLLMLIGLVAVLLLVLLAIVWPWLSEWADRATNDGEPDLDDPDRGGL